jgi:hypothetical protein
MHVPCVHRCVPRDLFRAQESPARGTTPCLLSRGVTATSMPSSSRPRPARAAPAANDRPSSRSSCAPSRRPGARARPRRARRRASRRDERPPRRRTPTGDDLDDDDRLGLDDARDNEAVPPLRREEAARPVHPRRICRSCKAQKARERRIVEAVLSDEQEPPVPTASPPPATRRTARRGHGYMLRGRSGGSSRNDHRAVDGC